MLLELRIITPQHFITSIAFAKSLIYAQQPLIVDAYQGNHCRFQKRTLKSPLVDFKQGCEWWVSYHSLVEIQLKAIKSEVIHSFVPCNAFCYLVILILRYFILPLMTSMQTVLMTCMGIAYDCSQHLCQQRSRNMGKYNCS